MTTAALNATESAVGVSNVFSTEVEGGLPYPGSEPRGRVPGLALVAYEQGASLEAAVAAGFQGLGGLTVWSWEPAV